MLTGWSLDSSWIVIFSWYLAVELDSSDSNWIFFGCELDGFRVHQDHQDLTPGIPGVSSWSELVAEAAAIGGAGAAAATVEGGYTG